MDEPLRIMDEPLRVAMLAPPWIPVPPPAYGGIESVVALLVDALVARGNEVTLIAARGSRSGAELVHPLERVPGEEIERSLHEADHVARAFALVDEDGGYDIVHDHCGFTALAFADRLRTPVVHTLHGPFDDDTAEFYAEHAHKGSLVAISQAQADMAPDGVEVAAVVPNPVDIDAIPLQTGPRGEHLLWLNRFAPVKGADRAIEVARRAGRPLVLAGPIQNGQQEHFEEAVEPHVDGVDVRYVGEVGGEEKLELLGSAAALLMPIRWPEPFGMAMVEAMASGTPVLAFPEGAAPEVVQHGVSGFVCEDEAAMADAVARLDELDPHECRRSTERFLPDVVAQGYEDVYVTARATMGSLG
jgi:glycosyltransferase involved in cell wall biosynthesis